MLVVSAVYTDKNGIKFNPDLMERERLYHCMFHNKAILIFKDSQDVLNCYEIEDVDLVEKIRQCKDDAQLALLFDAYLAEHKLA